MTESPITAEAGELKSLCLGRPYRLVRVKDKEKREKGYSVLEDF